MRFLKLKIAVALSLAVSLILVVGIISIGFLQNQSIAKETVYLPKPIEQIIAPVQENQTINLPATEPNTSLNPVPDQNAQVTAPPVVDSTPAPAIITHTQRTRAS